MLGCRCHAKWNAAEWVDEAVAGGTRIRKCARVDKVLIDDGQVVGVLGVIGPTRMAYERVIPIVDATARILSAALNPKE